MTKQIYNPKVQRCSSHRRPQLTYRFVMSERKFISLRNWRGCMKIMIKVEEATIMCKDHHIWY